MVKDLVAPNGNLDTPDAQLLKGAVFCTMWDSYNGEVLGVLQGWGCQQYNMLVGEAKLLEDPTGTNVPRLVLKSLHLSKTSHVHVKRLVASIFKELIAKAPVGLKEKLVMPSESEVLAIEKAFRFVGSFDERIRDVLKGMPQNAKKANLETLKQEGQGKQLWSDYQAAGHSAEQFSCQISRILTKDKKKKEREKVCAAAVAGGHAAAGGQNEEGGDSDDEEGDEDMEDNQEGDQDQNGGVVEEGSPPPPPPPRLL